MSKEIKYLYLKSHPFFAGLTEKKVQDASRLTKIKTVPTGVKLGFGEADASSIFLLIKGKIKITESFENGGLMIKEILTAPDVFGDLSLDNIRSGDDYAEALTSNIVLCCFNVGDFRQCLYDNPSMVLNYAKSLHAKLMGMERRLSDLFFRDAKSRLLRFIHSWAVAEGNRVGDRIVLNNCLTHSDIANIILTSRQSVNVLLNELRDSGTLRYDRKIIELYDPIN